MSPLNDFVLIESACTPSLTNEPDAVGMKPTSTGLAGFEMLTTYTPPEPHGSLYAPR